MVRPAPFALPLGILEAREPCFALQERGGEGGEASLVLREPSAGGQERGAMSRPGSAALRIAGGRGRAGLSVFRRDSAGAELLEREDALEGELLEDPEQAAAVRLVA
jgi:hypothetical protein